MEFEEVKYGMLMMVLCDREGKVYDVWMSVSLGFLPAFGFGTLRNGKAFSRSLRICL